MNITATHIYYYHIRQRKLWLFSVANAQYEGLSGISRNINQRKDVSLNN